MEKEAWFASWFDSPWYPVLYRHRDDQEAAAFIRRLVTELPLGKGARVCDLACGRGRHSRTLHEMGFDVTGLDLSPKSIADAQKTETDGLRFYIHDMRRSFGVNLFDAVFNLFTSFGYFDSVRDNRRVVSAASSALHAGGILVIDFFNAHPVIESLMKGNYFLNKEIDGAEFRIEKMISGAHVVKKIEVIHNGRSEYFMEKVQLLREEDFRELLKDDFDVVKVYGSYQLGAFDLSSSDRLIIVAKKKNKV